ncbi:MAG: hypothetical protein ACLTCB_02595 [Merdibacter sp.]
MIGAIRDEILPLEEVAFWAMGYLQTHQPQLLRSALRSSCARSRMTHCWPSRRKRGYLMNGEVERSGSSPLSYGRSATARSVSWERPDED